MSAEHINSDDYVPGWRFEYHPYADPQKLVLVCGEGGTESWFIDTPLGVDELVELALKAVNVQRHNNLDEVLREFYVAGIEDKGKAIDLIRAVIGLDRRFSRSDDEETPGSTPDAKEMALVALTGAVGEETAKLLLMARDAQVLDEAAEDVALKMASVDDTVYSAGMWSAVCWLHTVSAGIKAELGAYPVIRKGPRLTD